MSKKQKFNISELSYAEHGFSNYHFCRGNSNKRKSRFGLIEKGHGTYIYLNKKINVSEGDIVFIPERVYCYSEWHGDPEIKVTYISCFMNYDENTLEYEPQILNCNNEIWEDLHKIRKLLDGDFLDELEAYSLFYKLLQKIIPNMAHSNINIDNSLQEAVSYIMNNWDKNFSVKDISKECCISESKLYHLFQKQLGQTPVSFLNSIRINHAIQYLENSKYSISHISQLVCFNSENHFRKVFSDITGTTPLKFRKQAK